jgi:hypothetical protein
MPKFNVLAREVVFYSFVVEADTLAQAQAKIDQGDYNTGDPVDGDFFEIDDIVETQ